MKTAEERFSIMASKIVEKAKTEIEEYPDVVKSELDSMREQFIKAYADVGEAVAIDTEDVLFARRFRVNMGRSDRIDIDTRFNYIEVAKCGDGVRNEVMKVYTDGLDDDEELSVRVIITVDKKEKKE